MVSPRSIALIYLIDASHASPADSRTSATTGSIRIMRRLAKRDRAYQRAHQFRRKSLHPGIGHAGELVRKQLRGGQEIEQIVVDHRYREAKGGEPALLMQHR